MKVYREELRYAFDDSSIGVYIEEPHVTEGQLTTFFIYNTDEQRPFTVSELWFWRDELDADIAERMLSCK